MIDRRATTFLRGLIRAVLTGPVTGMFLALAGIELLGDHASVSPSLVRPGHCYDRSGHPEAEDSAHQ